MATSFVEGKGRRQAAKRKAWPWPHFATGVMGGDPVLPGVAASQQHRPPALLRSSKTGEGMTPSAPSPLWAFPLVTGGGHGLSPILEKLRSASTSPVPPSLSNALRLTPQFDGGG